uniref:DOMON domain-containing protein n=1 Tax=Ciona intestinalis TaxID=7719 RepID=H2XZG6_CIOIN
MLYLYIFAISILFFNYVGADVTPTESFPHNVILDSTNERVTLYWKNNDTHMTFEMHGQTTGWVGIGLSPNGGMIDADIYIGWVKDGNAYITDRHGQDSNAYPPKDPEQNVDLLLGYECDGWTVIKFVRQIPACEADYDRPITSDTIKMIWALEPKIQLVVSDDYHQTSRGKNYIIESMFPEGEEETHHSFDLINEEFHLPAVKSYYNCRVMALPQTGEKLHLVKSEPIIQPGHELFLHHILLYECAGDYAVPPTEHVNSNDQCYTANMPPGSESCQKVILAWAIGGGAFYFPKHTGLVFGVEGAPRYVVMETHYDNPNAMAGVVDSSGLRITYTSRLRQFDTGILELGHTVSGIQHIIPPQAQSFLSYGTCTENCMSSSMDDAGVTELNIYGVMQHSHLLGTGMKTRYFRGGVELPPLSEDKSYDFNYQETRILQEERVFKKGDAMQVVCNYKSMDETELTYGGLDTTKEMCMSFIYYYPAMQLSFCQTAAEYNTLLNYFGISEVRKPDLTNLAIVKPEELSNLTVADYIN